jgi:hypothetical protein
MKPRSDCLPRGIAQRGLRDPRGNLSVGLAIADEADAFLATDVSFSCRTVSDSLASWVDSPGEQTTRQAASEEDVEPVDEVIAYLARSDPRPDTRLLVYDLRRKQLQIIRQQLVDALRRGVLGKFWRRPRR